MSEQREGGLWDLARWGRALLARGIVAAHRGASTTAGVSGGVGAVDDGATVAVVDTSATWHEVSSTLAGIAAATEVLRGLAEPATGERDRLMSMMLSETRRLQRLVDRGSDRATADRDGREAPGPQAQVDWDDATDSVDVVDLRPLVEPLVLRLGANGTTVHAPIGDHRVVGRPDEISEVVSILLANCERHAPGSTVQLVAWDREDDVVLSLSDDGPGVPPGVGERIFAPGVRSAGSRGLGIGLHRARRLAEHNGGSLRHREGSGRGATFELVLPSGHTAARRPGRGDAEEDGGAAGTCSAP